MEHRLRIRLSSDAEEPGSATAIQESGRLSRRIEIPPVGENKLQGTLLDGEVLLFDQQDAYLIPEGPDRFTAGWNCKPLREPRDEAPGSSPEG